jgi:Zn-dependent metalloprotease
MCCFVAPHILKAIAASENVTQEVRQAAQKSLASTNAFTESRKATIAAADEATSRRPHHQGIVPPHVLRSISSSEAAGPEARASAQQTLLSSKSVKDARATHEETAVAVTLPRQLSRKIYDCKNSKVLVTNIARTEGDARVKDRSINNAYDGLGIVYDFFYNIFGRNSIDNKGLELIGNVHYQPEDAPAGYDNAFWDGSQMVFGDGDGDIFDDFTDSLDVLAHELTHGVTQYTAKLEYEDQAGALNESMSDVFACMCEQWWFGQTADKGDWLLGQGLLSMPRRGPALRSLKAPGTAYCNDPILGTDSQPGHMSGFVKTSDDDGGVHLNCGIPNRAFYLAATGLGGFSWDKAGQIWYKTLNDPAIPTKCTFKEFADLTVKQALALYGPGAATPVRSAWVGVGVLP